MMYDKGYQEFVDAARIIKSKYPNVSFELLGPLDNSPTMVLEDVIRNDEKDGVVKYLGVSNDLPSFMGRDSVVLVLLSSYGEGMNRSLMEGCSIGRPIITTNIPGCKELVDVKACRRYGIYSNFLMCSVKYITKVFEFI